MADTKQNRDLMNLNQLQLEEHITRSDIRRQRREVLERILEDREEYSGLNGGGKSTKGLVVGLVAFALIGISAASYLIYQLSLD